MSDIVVGVLAIAIGAFLCLRGHWAMRLLLAVWGAFVGFAFGARLVDNLTDQGYLDTPLGWIAAVLLAVVFAALAYLYFAISIILAMASMGFLIGGTVAAALGASDSWVLLLVGALCGIVLAGLAIVTNLPQVILIVVSAFAGAGVAVGGVMLVLDVVDADALNTAEAAADEHALWYVAVVVLAVIGIVVQFRATRGTRRSVRETWARSA